jgi:hypothetical protein
MTLEDSTFPVSKKAAFCNRRYRRVNQRLAKGKGSVTFGVVGNVLPSFRKEFFLVRIQADT